jgi:hypothetical protein
LKILKSQSVFSNHTFVSSLGVDPSAPSTGSLPLDASGSPVSTGYLVSLGTFEIGALPDLKVQHFA